MEDSNLKRALLEAKEAAIASSKDSENPDQTLIPQPRPKVLWWVFGLVVITAAGIGLAQPEWITGTPPVEESPEVSVASMRLALARERSLVESYYRSNGRLPATLAEAGSSATAIGYRVTGNSNYTLSYRHNGTALELRSSEPLAEFLGNSAAVIMRGRAAQ